MTEKNKIAAIVVWYNPSTDSIQNILSYIQGVGGLFVVDNSESEHTDVVEAIKQYKEVTYLSLGRNLGIAAALNKGAAEAKANGFEWLLTMDQDSCFSPGYIEQMIQTLCRVPQSDKVGVLSAVPSCSAMVQTSCAKSEWQYIKTAFTSGNLVRLEAWSKVGGWCEELFIDSVDYDFDFRIQLSGYMLVQCNNVIFEHHLGRIKYYKLFGKKLFASTHHNYIRRYYITRNRLYIRKWYADSFPEFIREEKYALMKEFGKILLTEQDKWQKIRSMYLGYKDFKTKKLGKYQW